MWEDLPRWMRAFIREKQCKECEQGVSENDVIAIGVRIVDKILMPYFEYLCPTCGHRSISAVTEQNHPDGYSLMDFCYSMLQERKNRRDTEKSRANEHGGEGMISDEEVKELTELLRTSETHEEFLKGIGVVPLKPFDKKKTQGSTGPKPPEEKK